MKRKKEDIVVIVFASILVIIVFIIVLTVRNSKVSQLPQQNTVTTQTSTNINSTIAPPTPTSPSTNGNPAVLYDSAAQDKLINAIQDRKSLSQNDMVAKANIIAQLPNGEKSGIVYSDPTLNIEYISSADLFQVEIRTTDIQSAKNAANVWFRAHGLSQQAICTMPVEFYLNYDIANHLRQTNIVFSPLGNGC